MTPQEQRILDSLLDYARQAQSQPRDPDMVQRIQQALGDNRDAIYPLAQAAVGLQIALEQTRMQLQQATEELTQLHNQASSATHKSGSFLSNFFGLGNSTPQQAPPAGQQSGAYAQRGYPPQPYPSQPPQQPYPPQPYPAYPPPGYTQPYPQQGYGQPGFGSPGGSMLGGIAQTAAGVVAGEMVYQGIESALHGGHHERGFDQPQDFQGGHDSGGFYNPHADASRDLGGNDTGSQFADTGTDDNLDALDQDTSDSSFDDSGSDDGGFDDGGGSDDSI